MMTRDVAVQIMERLRSGKKQLAVAHEFGVSERTISSIVSGTHCCWRADWKPPRPKAPKRPKPKKEQKPVATAKPKRGKADRGCYMPSQEQIAKECAAIRAMWSGRELLDRAGLLVDAYEFPTVSFSHLGAA